MTTLAIALGAFIFYLIAYHTYGKWLGSKIFKLDAEAKVPSIELEDGSDYVPTSKGVGFWSSLYVHCWHGAYCWASACGDVGVVACLTLGAFWIGVYRCGA